MGLAEIAAVFRDEYGRAVSVLIRVLGDFELAEDAVADAFARAVQRWPVEGRPPGPAGWIITTARNRAIDHLRREVLGARKYAEAAVLDAPADPVEEGAVPDDRLRLAFTCCHPALNRPAQVALTLRLLGGLTTPEIARAFLVPEATMAQRIVRAKAKIRAARIPYRVPWNADLPDRLDAVLAVVYIIFNEGYATTSASQLVRADCATRRSGSAAPSSNSCPASRNPPGCSPSCCSPKLAAPPAPDADGAQVRLADQDRSRWDAALVRWSVPGLRRWSQHSWSGEVLRCRSGSSVSWSGRPGSGSRSVLVRRSQRPVRLPGWNVIRVTAGARLPAAASHQCQGSAAAGICRHRRGCRLPICGWPGKACGPSPSSWGERRRPSAGN